jgi:hypothetical protein
MNYATQEEILEVSSKIEVLLGRKLTDLELPIVELAVRYYSLKDVN